MFVLLENTKWGQEYYEGGTYMYHGEYFPCITSKIDEAKKYSTRKRAENACNKINMKCGRMFKVVSIEELK